MNLFHTCFRFCQRHRYKKYFTFVVGIRNKSTILDRPCDQSQSPRYHKEQGGRAAMLSLRKTDSAPGITRGGSGPALENFTVFEDRLETHVFCKIAAFI